LINNKNHKKNYIQKGHKNSDEDSEVTYESDLMTIPIQSFNNNLNTESFNNKKSKMIATIILVKDIFFNHMLSSRLV